MQRHVPAAQGTRPLWLVVLCAGVIVGTCTGLRQVMGLYLTPTTSELGIGREPFSSAMAVANLVWGLAAVLAGVIADRQGAGRVVAAGALSTVAGLYLMFAARSGSELMLSGVLLGIGISGTGLNALVGAVGRAAPPTRRTSAIAALGMAGGIGGFLAFPYTHLLMDLVGWKTSLLVLMATIAAIMPLAWPLAGKPNAAAGIVDPQTLGGALREAATHPSYLLLLTGFFVCGFHVAFIATHLPVYVTGCGLPAMVGAVALALIGFFNMVGSYVAGLLGGRYRKKYLLSALYFGRGVVIAIFLWIPPSEASVLAFSAAMGLLWLGTVPLTSGLVGQIFGVRHLATLFGLVLLAHQIGAFLGAWLGGYIFDLTGSYDEMWLFAIGLGLLAAAIHWPIADRPLAGRLGMSPARV